MVACTIHYRPWTGSIKPSLHNLKFCCFGLSLEVPFFCIWISLPNDHNPSDKPESVTSIMDTVLSVSWVTTLLCVHEHVLVQWHQSPVKIIFVSTVNKSDRNFGHSSSRKWFVVYPFCCDGGGLYMQCVRSSYLWLNYSSYLHK